MNREPRTILAISASRFGSSLGLIPALRILRERYSASLITAAACTGTCEIITPTGFANRTIDLGVIKPSGRTPAKALKLLYKLLRKTRADEFDLVLDFSPQLETRIAAALNLGARRLSTSRLPRILELIFGLSAESFSDGDYAAVLRKLGLKSGNMQLDLAVDVQESERFERLIQKAGVSETEKLVVLFAGDAADSPRSGWPIERFLELAWRLDNNLAGRPIVIDVPHDQAFTDVVGGRLPKNGLTIRSPGGPALVAALARASLVVTDDSGVARFSAELGVPTLEIAGNAASIDEPAPMHRRSKGDVEHAYTAACELLQSSRTALLFGRR